MTPMPRFPSPALRPLRPLAVAALLSLGAGAALAQASAPPASPAKRELVQRVLQAQKVGLERVGADLATQTAGQSMQIAAREMQRVPAAKREATAKEMQAEVKKFHDDISPMLRERAWKLAPDTYGTLLLDKLSEDELKQLLAWLESPLSVKFQQLTNEAYPAVVQKVVADTRSGVEPKIKALEARLKAVAAAAGATAAPAAPAAAASGGARK